MRVKRHKARIIFASLAMLGASLEKINEMYHEEYENGNVNLGVLDHLINMEDNVLKAIEKQIEDLRSEGALMRNNLEHAFKKTIHLPDFKDLYLIVVYGDVEPCIKGPFKTLDERDNVAGQLRREEDNEDGIYKLYINADGTPEIFAYPGWEMDELVARYDARNGNTREEK